jgi:hypothetical protein
MMTPRGVSSLEVELAEGQVFRVGKHRFLRIVNAGNEPAT